MIDAIFGDFLLSKNNGKIILVAPIEMKNGYRKPDQKDSFQIRTLPIPRKTQSKNNITQAIMVPCFARDFLKS